MLQTPLPLSQFSQKIGQCVCGAEEGGNILMKQHLTRHIVSVCGSFWALLSRPTMVQNEIFILPMLCGERLCDLLLLALG